jgi:hypothetical protein
MDSETVQWIWAVVMVVFFEMFMNTAMQVPEGYLQDMRGRLIPLSQIKPMDLERSDLVVRLCESAKAEQERLRDFKA